MHQYEFSKFYFNQLKNNDTKLKKIKCYKNNWKFGLSIYNGYNMYYYSYLNPIGTI